ncbi:MAG: hypothetical protein NZ480_04465, partial [Bdellovibrionaceae bacterium]|nr:hypothetical protein [Pseudobdellovibrionaceae bacterium]MDW8190004.1 hypothetical protein [Pseudobdellovibrionaceae bacterium]
LEVVRYLQSKGVPLRHMRIQGFGELMVDPQMLGEEELEKLHRLPASEKKVFLNDLARTIRIVVEPKEAL